MSLTEVDQVISVEETVEELPSGGSKKADRFGAETQEEGPIVELKNSSSSSSNSRNSSSSSDCENTSTRLVRRRTVRRYHQQATTAEHLNSTGVPVKDPAESISVISTTTTTTNGKLAAKQEESKSHFRTRPIGAYLSQQAQTAASSASSKIAKCSITTNRKQTSSSSHQSLVSESASLTNVSSLGHPEASNPMKMQQDPIIEHRPRLKLRLDQSKLAFGDNFDPVSVVDSSSIEVKRRQEEESSSVHRESFSCSASLRKGAQQVRKEATASSEAASSTSASSSIWTTTRLNGEEGDLAASSSLSRSFKSSTSSSTQQVLLATDDERLLSSNDHRLSSSFLMPGAESRYLSPGLRTFVEEVGSDFALLENAGRRLLSPTARPAATTDSSGHLFDLASQGQPLSLAEPQVRCIEDKPSVDSRAERIKELMSKANSQAARYRLNGLSEPPVPAALKSPQPDKHDLSKKAAPGEPYSPKNVEGKLQQQHSHCKAVMSKSIERIDQRMSDLCKKLRQCDTTKEAVELLKVMVQMVEKAWSVPICGDDLGFKLCSSLRVAGGLDIILDFLHKSELARSRQVNDDSEWPTEDPDSQPGEVKTAKMKNSTSLNPLRLNLSKINEPALVEKVSTPSAIGATTKQKGAKESDSDVVTSDLGLDSTSVESLSYVSASAASPPSLQDSPRVVQEAHEPEQSKSVMDQQQVSDTSETVSAETTASQANKEQQQLDEAAEASLRKEELIFLSARLLSQCLTSDNRDYIVWQSSELEPVISLACNFTNIKSSQSHRLLSLRSHLQRQRSSVRPVSPGPVSAPAEEESAVVASQQATIENTARELDSGERQSDMHAIVGTEILQHLFKHSEDTCSKMISAGGLSAILYCCRSNNVETLRHCASALVNLALYGGPDSQALMIEQKAHVWLFPLAFNEDDNVQYYACLAIAVLAANQQIEADVLKSSTLDLVEPFVTNHEPRKFAKSTTSHIHGQSNDWLRRLVPLLESRREEARNLACFHFAMEAYIKREQGQTQVFKDIGAVEPLRRAGSSPIAIASKFACQALRLIGEREPHRLTQQVPLWTNQDVLEWVSQIGFERFRGAFVESRVDGDLLLQLDDEALRTDLGLDNGIVRRRFLRELANLRRIADYSSVDRTGLGGLLQLASAQRELVAQYIYQMIQLGVDSDNIRLLDCDQLLAECKVQNAIHRLKLNQAIKGAQERQAAELAANGDLGQRESHEQALNSTLSGGSPASPIKTLDVFVSYRRSTGSQLASLLKVHLQLRGFSVFIDVERLVAGKFDNKLLDSIKSARNFILVLSPNALDRCIGDLDCKDWVHKEIVAALANNCNIIPIMDNFVWPDGELLPEDMRSISNFNGVRWIHDYQEACVDKVERFIRGELSNGLIGGVPTALNQRHPTGAYSISTPSLAATPASLGFPQSSVSSARISPFEHDHPLSSYQPQSLFSQHHQFGHHQPNQNSSSNNNNNNNAQQQHSNIPSSSRLAR